jgi:hypothetical protein
VIGSTPVFELYRPVGASGKTVSGVVNLTTGEYSLTDTINVQANSMFFPYLNAHGAQYAKLGYALAYEQMQPLSTEKKALSRKTNKSDVDIARQAEIRTQMAALSAEMRRYS